VAGGAHRGLAIVLLCAGLLAGAIGLLSRSVGLLGWLEQRSVDARFALRGSVHPSDKVAIVALDTESYRHLPLPPLPRTLDAELIEKLNRAGARVIAFDFALERPSTDARADEDVIRALARAKRAVVSVTAIEPGARTSPLGGRVLFASVGVRPGVTLLELDSDGAVRRFPSGLGGVDSFALAAAQSYSSAVGGSVPRGALIDYPGPPGSVPALSFVDVLAGRFDARAVRGKIVVVGPTAPVLQDVHQSPVGAAMSGPEIQADAIATALDGFPLRGVSALTTAVILLSLGLMVPMLAILPRWALRRSTGRGADALANLAPDTMVVLGIGLIVVVAWSLAAQLAFDDGAVLDYADGLLTVALATGGVWVLAEALDRRERRRLRMLFAASSPDVVAQVLHAPDGHARVLTARSVIAGYRIEQEIGRGGMGVVYRASQLHLERPVALKLIRPEFAQSSLYRARFERESRLAAAVSHPNVIPVIDAGDDAGLLYLAMQFISGINLASVLKGTGLLDPHDAALLLHQIAGALDAAHDQGLVHRDVKPANIVLRAEDPSHALLTDFGLAKNLATGDEVTQLEGWAGTIDYLAPEQLEGGQVDHRADIYALTAVLYHCLTGSVPFPREETFAKIAAHMNAPRPSATRIRPDLPAAIDLVIARGMAVSPADRHPSAGAVAADAGSVLGVPARRPALEPTVPPQGVSRISEDAPTEVSDPRSDADSQESN
jgi:serine/threonine protein kinase/CHASE2 domain-containing sensor protein